MIAVPDLLPLVLLTLVAAAGSFIQSGLGFGLNLLLTPLGLLLLPEIVPIPALIANGVLSAFVAWRYRGHIDRRFTLIATVAALPGVIAGLLLLLTLEGRVIAILGGIVVLTAVVIQVASPRPREGKLATIAAGAFSGVLASTTSVTGPPVAVVLARANPLRRRATVAGMGAILTALTMICFAVLQPSELVAQAGAVLWLVPGIILGVLGHHFVGDRISDRTQRSATLIVSAVAAIVLIARAALQS